MEARMVRRISVPKISQRARDRVSEKIALKYIYRFFVRKNGTEMIKKDEKTTFMVGFEAMSPKGNLMKDLRSLFASTKTSRMARSSAVKLISAIAEMSVTPDLGLILQVIVLTNGTIDVDRSRSAVAIAEVKRGNAKPSSDQKKDWEIARKHGIPYYLLEVDDSDFMKRNFSLELKLCTPNLELTVPELPTKWQILQASTDQYFEKKSLSFSHTSKKETRRATE